MLESSHYQPTNVQLSRLVETIQSSYTPAAASLFCICSRWCIESCWSCQGLLSKLDIKLSVGETDPEINIINVPLYIPTKLELCVYIICTFCMVGLVRANHFCNVLSHRSSIGLAASILQGTLNFDWLIDPLIIKTSSYLICLVFALPPRHPCYPNPLGIPTQHCYIKKRLHEL